MVPYHCGHFLAGWLAGADGGGYQYRLCKADDPLGLTEACFTKTPLLFTGSTALRWGGKANGTSENITGHFATDSAPKAGLVGNLYTGIAVVPPGSIWAQNPIPDYVRTSCYNYTYTIVAMYILYKGHRLSATCKTIDQLEGGQGSDDGAPSFPPRCKETTGGQPYESLKIMDSSLLIVIG